MKILLAVCLFPFFGYAQPIDVRIKSAEARLSALNKKIDSIQLSIEDLKFQQLRNDLLQTGIPKLAEGEQVIFHMGYALVYKEQYEQASWVAHIILPDVSRGNEGRSNDFRPDTSIKSGSAEEADYFLRLPQPDSSFKYDGFGYDRGHLAPSADFRYSKKALSESYYYSNMSPQVAALNRGRWAEMEDLLRQYIVRNNTPVYVVTGGVLKPSLKKIGRGKNAVSIPEQYFKVVLDLVYKRGIGFIMPNKECVNPVMNYACTIDSVESVTGHDFFARLPAGEENAIENTIDFSKWANDQESGDALPLKADNLPRNTFNTVQAQFYMGKNLTVKVCGKVVSTRLSSKGNVFLNLDKKFPNQVFSITIFKENVPNFSYSPDTFLAGKTICVTGKISNFNGTPTMNITNENAVIIEEDDF